VSGAGRWREAQPVARRRAQADVRLEIQPGPKSLRRGL